MKRFAIALGMCAVLITATEAYASSHIWSGAHDTVWTYIGQSSPHDNWNDDTPGDYPKRRDTALVIGDPNENQPVLYSYLQELATVTIDAHVLKTASLSLEVADGGCLTTSGTVLVRGKLAAAENDFTATMAVSGGTFGPNNLDLDGGPEAGNEAVLTFAVSVTVGGKTGTDTSVDGLVHMNLTATGVEFDAKEVKLEDSAVDLVVTGAGTTDTKFRYDKFEDGTDGDVDDATFEFVGPLTVECY